MPGKNVHATEFVPCNTAVKNSGNSMRDPDAFTNNKPKIIENLKPFKGFGKDPQRTFSRSQGKQLWKLAHINDSFDPRFFRQDFFGCLVAHDIKYSGNENVLQRKLAYDMEHLISHSKNGITDIGNGDLLCSGINRSKGDTECFTLNVNEYSKYKERFGIIPEDLLIELENNLHETCRKYNLVFIKNQNNVWTLKNDTFEYFQYNDEYDNDNETYFEEDFDSNPKERFESNSKDDFESKSEKDEKEKPSVFNAFLLAAGAKIVTENVVLASCSVYNYTFTKTRNALYKENNTATFETTDTQKTVANIAGWSAGLYIGVSTLM
jgi:hypothetical protein